MRQARRLNRLQENGEIGEPVSGWIADDDRKIDDSKCRRGLLREFNRAGAIDERPRFAHECAMPEPELSRHRACGWTFRCRAGGRQQRLKQSGFAAAVRAYKCDGAWARRLRL